MEHAMYVCMSGVGGTDGNNKNASPERVWPLSGQQAEGHAAGVKLHLQRCPFVILSSEYH